MAESKLIRANEKIAEGVTGRFQKLQSAVVDGYTRIEDKFVAQYLTREGESVADAKTRLKAMEAARQAQLRKDGTE